MHTILKGKLTNNDFAVKIPEAWLDLMNEKIVEGKLDEVKALLPESFLQRRMWCMSYKTLQNIYNQRKTHKLQEWRDFLKQMLEQMEHPDFIDPDCA